MHSGTGVGVGYNVQIAVDTKHKLIAEQQVPSQVSDLGLLAETGRAARTSLGVERIDAVADKGYFKVEDSAGCEAAGITPYVPKPRRSPARRSGRFPKERFRYDAGTDTYACPNGQQLKPLYISRVRDTTLMHDANRGACRGCALKAQCTSNSYRPIGRYADEAVLDRMAERLADRPGVLHRRRESAEHPFGSIKHWMGHGGFLMRRLENVRGEFSLTALAYNIRRATTLVGIPELIAAGSVRDRRVGRSNQLESPPQGPVSTHQGAWHQRIYDNPLTAQIPGLSHRKIRLWPTFHTVLFLYEMSLNAKKSWGRGSAGIKQLFVGHHLRKELLHIRERAKFSAIKPRIIEAYKVLQSFLEWMILNSIPQPHKEIAS